MLACVEEGACLSIGRICKAAAVNVKLRESCRISCLMLILNRQDAEISHEAMNDFCFCLEAILNI